MIKALKKLRSASRISALRLSEAAGDFRMAEPGGTASVGCEGCWKVTGPA
jgi:hypothetical protein